MPSHLASHQATKPPCQLLAGGNQGFRASDTARRRQRFEVGVKEGKVRGRWKIHPGSPWTEATPTSSATAHALSCPHHHHQHQYNVEVKAEIKKGLRRIFLADDLHASKPKLLCCHFLRRSKQWQPTSVPLKFSQAQNTQQIQAAAAKSWSAICVHEKCLITPLILVRLLCDDYQLYI